MYFTNENNIRVTKGFPHYWPIFILVITVDQAIFHNYLVLVLVTKTTLIHT